MLKSLRHALRLLRKAPGFTLVSICSLAIGIGATSAMFSFARRAAVAAAAGSGAQPNRGRHHVQRQVFSNTALSYPDYRDFRDGNRSFDGLMAASGASFGFKPNATALPKIAYGMYVSGNFFRVLGVQPALGRAFLDTEDQAVGRDAVVVLGHDFWVHQYERQPIRGGFHHLDQQRAVYCDRRGSGAVHRHRSVRQVRHVRSARDVAASERRPTFWRSATCAGSR